MRILIASLCPLKLITTMLAVAGGVLLAIAISVLSGSTLVAVEHRVPADRVVELVGALSDHRRPVYEPAIGALIALGTDMLPELAVLSKDPNAAVRARVAMVASGIGNPQALPVLERLTYDRDHHVREVAVLGLGATADPKAFTLLLPFLNDPTPEVRESAGLALGALGDLRAISPLTLWPEAGGARANLQLDTPPRDAQQLKRIQKAMQTSLGHLVMRPSATPEVIKQLVDLPPYRQVLLIEATWQIGDVRLTPTLVSLLRSSDADVRRAAATSLGANGDGRALQALCATAGDDPSPSVRDAAAVTLRRLTGHQAGPGPAWKLWWREHGPAVSSLLRRDQFIADLYNPRFQASIIDLAEFTPQELMPLVDGVLGDGAAWWPALAWRALRSDDSARWTKALVQRMQQADSEPERVAMVLLLSQLGDPAARAPLRSALAAVRERRSAPGPQSEGSLELALILAVEGAQRAPLVLNRN